MPLSAANPAAPRSPGASGSGARTHSAGPAAKLTRAANASPIAGKSVVFALGSQSCSGTTDSSGVASCSLTPTQAPGSYTVTASFAGDSGASANSDSKPFTVSKANSVTSMSAAPSSPLVFGTSTTFTAVVAGERPGGVTPTGSVVFMADGVLVGSGALVNGSASIATSSLGAGSHTVTATYGGDAYYLGSSGSQGQSVSCAANISGYFPGELVVTKSTCLTGARIGGRVIVKPGASLDVESSRLEGELDASDAPGTIRVCRSSVVGRVIVKDAGGLVIIGDPGSAACASNVIGGSFELRGNHHGVEAIDNTVFGAIQTSDNSGPGPFPGDQTTISGNHQPAPAPTPIPNPTSTPASTSGLSPGSTLASTPPLGSASFAAAKKTVAVSGNGTFSYAFSASPLAHGNAVFETDRAFAARTRTRHRRRLALGHGAFLAAATGNVKITIKLSRKNLKTLKAHRRLAVRLTATIDGHDYVNHFTLTAPKPKHHKR
ncbi:MAG: hypothetical protein DLM67_16235 [Candidatus Nephthysia bennettiae]|nr:MAG: hypothetical protein DLM67_16235 [Candidatus Dormibacteraeota bacterium]